MYIHENITVHSVPYFICAVNVKCAHTIPYIHIEYSVEYKHDM